MGKTEHGAGHSGTRIDGQGAVPSAASRSAARPEEHRGFPRRIFQWFLNRLFIAQRPLTLGVRAAAFDQAGRIFLVRHTYIAGWYLPGGGVEVGETVYEALERELAEEGNIALVEPPELFAIYHNTRSSRRDHVALFVCRNVAQSDVRVSDMEIAEAGFFGLDDLPSDTTPATRRRLNEIAQGSAAERVW